MTVPRNAFPRSHVISTIAIVALSTVSSLLGPFRPGHYTDPPASLARTRAEDLVILTVAVPALAIGLRYAIRGSVRGRIVWLGALVHVTYLWLSRAGTLAFNDFFLGYVALLSLSLFTLVGGTVTTDAESIRRRLDGEIARSIYVGVLALTSVGLALLWLSDIVPATLAGTTPAGIREFGPKGAVTYVFDLGLLVPSYAIGAHLLRRGHEWGFVTAGILLVLGALMAPTLSAITVIDLREGVAMTPGTVVGTILPPVLVGAFALGYLSALGGRSDERDANRRSADT